LTITYLESVDSTQIYLKNILKDRKILLPHAIIANQQTDGLGSRENSWVGLDGNLFLSFAISLSELPKDLKFESASIYFAYILKETLSELGSSVWLKWPNDFYLDNCKIGGMITNIIDDVLVCGVGLNLVNAPNGFTTLDIKISKIKLLKQYFEKIEKKLSWKQVFSKYKLEFYKNQNVFTHFNGFKIPLDGVELQKDGSILHNGERIYSRR